MTQIIAAAVVACAVGLASPQLAKDAAIAKAEAILKNLQDGNAADIVKELDAKIAAELPESKLKPAWTGLVGKFGAFKGITERREGLVKDRQAVELFLAFEKETVVQRAVFDKDGKVSGLVFRPVSGSVLPPNK
jgi:hypothetical protein